MIKRQSPSKIKLAECRPALPAGRLRTVDLLRLLLTAYCLFAFTTEINPTIRYVSPTGNNIPPYLTWEDAANAIQDCIDESEFGDTIYVGNGVYEEQVVMINGLSLVGAGTDSCVIDTRALVTSQNFTSVIIADSCLFAGFHILIYHNPDQGVGIFCAGNSKITQNQITTGYEGIYLGGKPLIYKNILNNVSVGIELFNSNGIARENLIYTAANSQLAFTAGIYIQAFDNSYRPLIELNYIETYGYGVRKIVGSIPTITNNTISLKSVGARGIYVGGDSIYVYNNLILTDAGFRGIQNVGAQYLQIYNNYLIGRFNYGIIAGSYNTVKNNVVTDAINGISLIGNTDLTLQYNNVWNNELNYSGFTPDSTNLSVDPMIVNDDTSQGELDFRLQMYSPLIDAGDPDILDKDGSRSDIGLYGGPYGWTYTYMDLAPRPPHNLTAVIEAGLVKLTWNKNTEADFSHYRIYRDTVSNFIYDTTKIVGTTTDTVFYDNLPITNSPKTFYYKLTALDNQNNQSAPSEEIPVLITGMTEHPPIGYDDYKLLSNYPNPFNPSTIIPYRLKEAGYVKLYIYDMKGELVKILVNQWQEKGYYEVVFHPTISERKKASSLEVMMGPTYSDMSSGVYLYQIMVRGEGNIPVFMDMGKMILMK